MDNTTLWFFDRAAAQTKFQYELFHACQTNDIKKITSLLDMGVDVNSVDFDTGK